MVTKGPKILNNNVTYWAYIEIYAICLSYTQHRWLSVNI